MKFCGYFKYLHEMILLADDIEVLVKLLPTLGYFICVVITNTVGEAKGNIEILVQEDLLNLGLDTRLLIDSEKKCLYFFCSLFLFWTK